jgi:hypothetical protein
MSEFASSRKVEQEYDASPEVVYEMFYQCVWKDGGGLGHKSLTKIVEQGDAVTHEGEVRSVPLNLLHEKILHTAKNELVEYTVLPSALSPFATHLGRVEFTPLDGGKRTKITWSVQYTAKPLMGAIVVGVVDGSFTFMLHTLKRQVAKLPKP